MALYSTETRRSKEQIMASAEAYFGPPGLGLEMEERAMLAASLAEAGPRSVTVLACEGKNTVELETREWDYHVKQFMQQIR